MARDRAGNTLGQAGRLRLTSTPKTFIDFVGTTDQQDVYRFRLGDRSTVGFTLTNIRQGANVDLELYKPKGKLSTVLRRIGDINFSQLRPSVIRRNLNRVGRSTRSGSVDESLSATLEAGTYFLRVYPQQGSSRYRLTASAAIAPISVPVDFSTWTSLGDSLYTATPTPLVTLTNVALSDNVPGNVSGRSPLTDDPGSQNFAQAIGLASSTQLDQGLGTGQFTTPPNGGFQEGSAIRNTSITAQAGTVFSFDWDFVQKDTLDVGFVKINSSLFKLDSNSPFRYTFPTSGAYDISVGVIDVNDFTGPSILQISNAQITPV
jgi:hypothetical protein